MIAIKVGAAIVCWWAAIALGLAQDGILATLTIRTPSTASRKQFIGLYMTGNDAESVTEVAYVIKKGGLTQVAEGIIPLVHGAGKLDSSLAEPGTLLVSIKPDAQRSRRGGGGAGEAQSGRRLPG